MEKSLLMCDSTEADCKAEIIMDYVMSYSLRHAADKYLVEKPILCRYCRYMLGVLLGIHIDNNTKVESIRVWKEWKYMDLCVEATIKEDGESRTYALLIENKYYTRLRGNQLEDYKKDFDDFYDTNKKVDRKYRRYRLISCLEENNKIESIYGIKVSEYPKRESQENFLAIPFYDLLPEKYWHEDKKSYEDTESEIFNEFWLRHW
jgi:hypothetical protein